MAAPIGTWISSSAWTSTPINGKFLVRPGGEVKVSDPPLGQTRTIGFWGKNSKNFEPYLEEFKKSDYWGLVVDSTGNIYTIVRLWEHKFAGDFVGMPKRSNNDIRSKYAQFAARYTGAKADPQIAANFGVISYPVFSKYAQASRGGYFAILTTSERASFETGKSKVGSDTTPPRPERDPGWDGTIPPVTGPGSGTGTTIGNQPFPDFSGLIPDLSGFTPPPPTRTGPNRPGGKWVVGADGKRYYLPPGLDFSGFKQPPPAPKPETKIVVRMPKGYAPPFSTAGTKPRMTQRQLDLTDSGQAIGTVTDTFIFPYIPQNIRYSDIGSAWQEVPRAMNTSFVDWAGYKLMKVSMDFLVSAQYIPSIKNSDGKVIVQGTAVSDGLMNSVTNELNMLRRMATNKFPVTLEGFDDILQIQMARSRFEQPRGLQFVIQDLNITAGRRTIDETTGLATTPSLISAAQVSITLQEIPVETVTIVKLPPLELGTPVVGKGGGGGGGAVTLGLQSETLTGLKWEIPAPADPNG
jgi:hypothetical protein